MTTDNWLEISSRYFFIEIKHIYISIGAQKNAVISRYTGLNARNDLPFLRAIEGDGLRRNRRLFVTQAQASSLPVSASEGFA